MKFWKKPCHYCGYAIFTIGLDRIDNSDGYRIGNVVSCCSLCNRSKNNLSAEKFISQCAQVAIRHAPNVRYASSP